MSGDDFQFPAVDQHTTIIGRNGSGKTQCGAWLLSHAPFDRQPFIIIDYKGDKLLNSIGAVPVSIYEKPPEAPGLYIAHVTTQEDDVIEQYLWQVHAQNDVGLFLDEGYMLAKSKALEAILMQGRSKHIPCYVLSQRPSWMTRYAFSEASHFVVYHLNDRRDRMKVKEFFNRYDEEAMQKYHAQWYHVNEDKNFLLPPVPSADTITERFIDRIDELYRLKNYKRFI